MGVLLGRKPQEERAVTFPHVLSAEDDDGSFSSVHASAGLTALQSIAVRSSIDLIASLCSELPVQIFSGRGSDRRERPMPEWLEDPDGSGYGLEDWGYRAVESWLYRGNLYGEILDRSPQGFITQAELFNPDRVTPMLDGGTVEWNVAGKDVPADDFLHRRVNPVAGFALGLSPIATHANSIGVSLTSTRYGYQWFKDGAHPGSLLKNSERSLTQRQVDKTKQWFMAAFRGNREPAVMGRGWEYEKIQIAPEESQFLQTQGFSEAQCARIFGPGIAEVLGYESGGSLTYTNVESRMAHVLVLSVNKWFRRYERLLGLFLPRSQHAHIDRDALLQSTTLERFRAHALALSNRWKVVNEVRDDEDLAPVEWGNEPNGGLDSEPPADTEPTGAEAPAPIPQLPGGRP